MSSKSTKNKTNQQIAGIIPGDYGTEFVGCRKTFRVHTYSNGRRIAFALLHPELKALIYQKMLNDTVAMAFLKDMSYDEALERYVFCIWGGADGTPDISDMGVIGPADNFSCAIPGCNCNTWPSKKILLNGEPLTPREAELVPRLASDDPDKKIASDMGISINTLTSHKQNIYAKAGVMSRTGLVSAAFKHNII